MYDLIIVGSGPAGLTASIYASCYHMKHLVIGGVLGGQMQLAPDILNFPGFNNISGKELTMKMAEQVKTRGGEIVVDSVVKINHIAAGPAAPAEVGLTFLRTSRPDLIGTQGGGSAQKASLPADSSSSITNKNLSLDKVFIEIGGVPGTALVIPLGVKMDQGGYIEVNERLATNVHGIFAAGDLVSYGLSIEQISSAVGLGARAAASAFTFIKQEKAPTVWGGSQIRR